MHLYPSTFPGNCLVLAHLTARKEALKRHDLLVTCILNYKSNILLLGELQPRYHIINASRIDCIFDIVSLHASCIARRERIAGSVLEQSGHETGRIIETKLSVSLNL